MSTPPPLPGAEPTLATFLRAVLRSGLLEQADLDAALRALPADRREDAAALAEHLVRKGRLSRFQARKLLRGAGRGLVLGPYQVLAPIGKGGMGAVYLARDGRDRRLLALKVLRPTPQGQERRRLDRFRREMELSRRVDHPNVCRTYEAGEGEGLHYIAMEFIPGRTLSRLVAEGGPLPLPRAARLLAQVAAGLAHAHAQGLIHRDLKPSNIMITPLEQAKVLDLGLALLEGEDTDDRTLVGGKGYIIGTVDYMAPEQIADPTDVDARSDIYALGCVLYLALAGRPPFQGGTRPERARRHRTETPPPLTELVPGLPPAFAALVGQMLAKDPRARPATASAVETELHAWAAGEPPPSAQPDRPWFVEAVTALQTADTSTDFDWDDLPRPNANAREGRGQGGCLGLVAALAALAGLATLALAPFRLGL
jgi:serine/threonine protein kinase